jgi:hypothetical protein
MFLMLRKGHNMQTRDWMEPGTGEEKEMRLCGMVHIWPPRWPSLRDWKKVRISKFACSTSENDVDVKRERWSMCSVCISYYETMKFNLYGFLIHYLYASV